MDKARFESLVAQAVERLPEEFREQLDNIDIVVQDWPNADQLGEGGVQERRTLLGLYEGIPHTLRGGSYGLVPPDVIYIFQKPIEARCRSNTEIEVEIGRVVRHEIAHHFGTDDKRLDEIETGWDEN